MSVQLEERRSDAVVQVLPHANGSWLVRTGDDGEDTTQHATLTAAEREARRRAGALGIGTVRVRDRYARVRHSRVPLASR